MVLNPESMWAYGLSVPLSMVQPWDLTAIPGVGAGLASGIEKLAAKGVPRGAGPIETLKKIHGVGDAKAKKLCGYFFDDGCGLEEEKRERKVKGKTKKQKKSKSTKEKTKAQKKKKHRA